MRNQSTLCVVQLPLILLFAWPGMQQGSCDESAGPPAADHRIRAISYNVQFLPGVAALANKRPDPEYRARRLSQLLREFDIVGLNEVFQDQPRQTILHGLKEAWGDQFGMVEGPAPDQPGRFNGGLAIATRLPMISSHAVVYRNYSRPEDFGFRADGYAAKGVLHARLKRSATAANNDCIDVFVTHMEARDDSLRPLQYAEMATFVQKHTAPGRPVLIMGDFNTRGALTHRMDPRSQYSKLMKELTSALPEHQMQDLWPSLHGDSLGGTSEQESADIGKRIDYIMLAVPNAANGLISCTDVRVNPFLDPRTVALSDHSAVEADLNWGGFQNEPSPGGQSRIDHPMPFVAGFERFARHGQLAPAEAGRLLASELSCTACHASSDAELKPKNGPNLTSIGNRVTVDWLRAFLQDPQQVKPGTTMPQVLHGVPQKNREETLNQLVAFLGSLQRPFREIKGTGAVPVPHEFWKQGKPEQGRRLFHRVGCVACHQPDETYETVRTKPTPLDRMLEQLDEDELNEMGLDTAARRIPSVPLGRPETKYTAQSLTHFLLDPYESRPAGRMPNFGLGVVEAADIAAWLLTRDEVRTENDHERGVEDSDIAIAVGRRHFSNLGCVKCHDAGIESDTAAATAWESLQLDADASCLNTSVEGLPYYPLDQDQERGLQAAISSVVPQPETPNGQLLPTLASFNCYACHVRDQLGGVGRYRKRFFETYGHIDIGDEGRLPPQLTGVGHKLQPMQLQASITGKARPRPYMSIRMPSFPDHVAVQLAKELSRQDFRSAASQQLKSVDALDVQLDAGRRLLDVGCVQCHPLAGENLPGVVGVDLGDVVDRVRPEWFHEFLLNPADLKSGTRMPSFFPQGRSQNSTILEGDAKRQITAIYAYLKQAKQLPLPDKLQNARSASYELVANDRPVLLRTFMKQAGTHALAVALPEKVNFAFDTRVAALAYLWKGPFLDAQGTWFMRFVPDAQPLGDAGHTLPAGSLLAELPAVDAAWPDSNAASSDDHLTAAFGGYRIDEAGVPEFLYRSAGCEVSDRLTVTDSGTLSRRLTLTSKKQRHVWLRAIADTQLEHEAMNCRTSSGLTVRLNGPVVGRGSIVRQNDQYEWRVPLVIDGTTSLEIDYVW